MAIVGYLKHGHICSMRGHKRLSLFNWLVWSSLRLTTTIIWKGKYRISAIRRHGYYLFHHANLCGYYSRAVFIKLSMNRVKIFCKNEGFQLSLESQCCNSVLKQNFKFLDQPLLYCKAVTTRDSIRRDTASLDTAGTNTEDLDPFGGIEEDEDKLEANEVLLEDC